MEYLTTEQTLTEKARIIAVPNTDPDPSRPFIYEITTRSPYFFSDDTVVVADIEVSAVVPPGINLLAKAIETIERKQEEIMAAAMDQKLELEQKKNALLMLGHTPAEDGLVEESDVPF